MSSERQDDTPHNPWWGEHVHRYYEALKLIPAKSTVLDLACGNGFGSFILSEHGHKVTGADISGETIKYCNQKYQKPNLSFHVMDGCATGVNEHTFNAVVSFETIEHTTRYSDMLVEFKRILKPEGLLILSTPNILINSPGGKVTNPFHTQEWNYEELKGVLSSVFPHVIVLGQRYSRYDKRGIKMSVGKIIEKLLYLRGLRKLPLWLQNRIIKLFTGTSFYPSASDYRLTSVESEIKKCKTFFAVCKLS